MKQKNYPLGDNPEISSLVEVDPLILQHKKKKDNLWKGGVANKQNDERGYTTALLVQQQTLCILPASHTFPWSGWRVWSGCLSRASTANFSSLQGRTGLEAGEKRARQLACFGA